MANRFTSFINKGVASITTAYNQQLKAAKQRAKARDKAARTKMEKERIKADLQHERLILERDMYEAKARVNADKAAVLAARKRAGVVTWGDRFGSLGQSMGKELGKALKGATKPPRRRTIAKPKSKSKRR